MTLRDLTEAELFKLQKRCELDYASWCKRTNQKPEEVSPPIWRAGYNQGLKAVLKAGGE